MPSFDTRRELLQKGVTEDKRREFFWDPVTKYDNRADAEWVARDIEATEDRLTLVVEELDGRWTLYQSMVRNNPRHW